MRTKTDFPRAVRELEHVWIPLSDGVRLAARVWLPGDAEEEPVPAVLEYLPYRKADWTARRDSIRQPYLAGHGYAAVRVDVRGSGDSEGILLDEYLPQEQEDALEVLRWIAAQPWCTGAVGMWGISWGGFNALQVAARRPPELRAVITLCSTDDRYADDVHYRGGCVLAVDMLPWAASMLAWNATPPDPRFHPEGWRELWLNRLERTPPFVEAWLTHQRRDAYWRQGSVCEDFAAIECPVYAVGGWVDGYTNAVFRLLEGLRCPRKGLVGPWAHTFPEEGPPGPAIGFLQECVRWWDHWLKGEENGVMDEPLLQAWLQEWAPPAIHYDERPGRWVAESSWPAPAEMRSFALGREGLVEESAEEAELTVAGHQATGLDSGLWCPYGDALDLPPDQRDDDARSLVFDSAPLEERVEVLGFPAVRLTFASDRPSALVAVRLCDVAPDGSSLVVSRAVLNLTHRESHAEPAPLVSGERYEVEITLDALGHAFDPGHRIRLALSSTYWPWVWPSPEAASLTLSAGMLALPLWGPGVAPVRFEDPEGAEPLAVEELSTHPTSRTVTRDEETGAVALVYEYGGGRRRLPNGTELEDETRETFTIVEGDPLSATVRVEATVALGRDEWRTRVETDSLMTCDAEHFHVVSAVTAYEGEQEVFSRSRPFSVRRDLV